MSLQNYKDFEKGNTNYVEGFGNKGSLPIPPGKKLAIVTCMDARLNPESHLGLKEGDAHIIRNAGGVAKEALRSLIISQQLLGSREIAVFHHTDCGMLTFTNKDIKDLLKSRNDSSAIPEIDAIDFLPFGDLEKSVQDDVQYLKDHPLISSESTITGWVYDVKTGKVRQVV